MQVRPRPPILIDPPGGDSDNRQGMDTPSPSARHRLEAAYAHWILHHRGWVLAAVLLLVALAAMGGQRLSFTTNYRAFFGPANPQLRAFDALEKIYAKQDNVLFLLAPPDGDVFTPRTLDAVEWLTREAWQIPYSSRVDSVTNFQYTEAEGDDLRVRDLVEDARHLAPAALARIRTIALHEPLLVDQLVSHDGRVAGVNVTVQLPGKHEATEIPETVAFVRQLVQRLQQRYPELEVHVTGLVMMNNAFTEASMRDMTHLVPLAFAIMLLALLVLTRSLWGVLVTTLVIVFSILTAMGLGGWLGMHLTPPSASAPTIILTLAIASSVHLITSYLHELRRAPARARAMEESLRINLEPVILTSVTTAIGFLSMNFSESPPFRDLGNLVAMGVLASLVYAVSFLPALMSLLPARPESAAAARHRAMAAMAAFVVRHRRRLLLGMGTLTLGLVALVPLNRLDDIYPHYFDESVPFRRDTDFAERNLGGLYRIDYSLEAGESGGIDEPAFLQEVERFANWWRTQPETIHVDSFTDTMRRLNKNMHGDDPHWYRLPRRRDLAAQYLLLYEMSLPYGLDLNNQINIDKSALRLSVTLTTMSTNQVLALERRARRWLQTHTRYLHDAEGTGPTIMFAHIGRRNIHTMLIGTTLALVLISLLLVVAFRSLRIGLISMIPNLVPAGMGFGIWALVSGEVGLGLSVVTGMTLGIVVDDTIHFLSKYLRARREQGLSSTAAVRYAFVRVGDALWITSVVLMAGFLVLTLSSFRLNADMGLLTAIVIGLALAADFLLLPSLLITLEATPDEKMAAVAAAGHPVGS